MLWVKFSNNLTLSLAVTRIHVNFSTVYNDMLVEKELTRLQNSLTLSLPVTRICVNFSTVYNDTLVAKGLK